MRAALTMDMLATDLADYLVRKGVRSIVYQIQYCLPNEASLLDAFPRDPPYIWSGRCTCGEEWSADLRSLALRAERTESQIRHRRERCLRL